MLTIVKTCLLEISCSYGYRIKRPLTFESPRKVVSRSQTLYQTKGSGLRETRENGGEEAPWNRSSRTETKSYPWFEQGLTATWSIATVGATWNLVLLFQHKNLRILDASCNEIVKISGIAANRVGTYYGIHIVSVSTDILTLCIGAACFEALWKSHQGHRRIRQVSNYKLNGSI